MQYFIGIIIIISIIELIRRAIKDQKGKWILIGVILFLIPLFPVNIVLCVLAIRRGIKLSKSEEIDEIKKNMYSEKPRGIIFGTKDDNYVIKSEDKDGHILIVGGAGSGKSSCVAIPTLRAWKSSVFAVDIKGELKDKRQGRSVKVFEPKDRLSYGYDPYYTLRQSKNPAQEARAIAEALIITSSDETKEPFWIDSAKDMLTGAILHFYREYSFLETLHEIQNTRPRELINMIYKSDNPTAKLFITSFVDLEDKTKAGIHRELSTHIVKIVTDEDLKHALSRDKNIAPDDLELHDIFVVVPGELLKQWKNLLTLMVNQFLNFFEQRPQYNNRPILFMLDEFPRLGKIPAILDGVAVLRDKKITVCPIIQSLAQLDYIYGDKARKIIVDNCSYKVVLSAEDADTQEYFSKMYGTYEKPQKSSGESFIGPLVLGRNKGVTEVEKRKIKPEEFATLPSTGKLALITPFGNSKVAKRPYYIPYKPPPKPQKKTVIERMFQALRRVFNSINRLIQ